MNDSTREIIAREIKKLDIAIEDGEAARAGAEVRLARIKADVAAARARRAELRRDLNGEGVNIVVNNVHHMTQDWPKNSGTETDTGPYTTRP